MYQRGCVNQNDIFTFTHGPHPKSSVDQRVSISISPKDI